MKASDLGALEGIRARITVSLPVGSGPLAIPTVDESGKLTMPTVSEKSFKLDIRVLNGTDEAAVLRGAREFATKNGLQDPQAGNELYELGRVLNKLLLACVDSDSPKDRPEPFFDQGIEQIQRMLDHDRILYLADCQQRWQEQCSPSIRKQSLEEFVTGLSVLGQEDEEIAVNFFEQLGPALQYHYTRFLASQWLNSQTTKSSNGLNGVLPTSKSK